MAEQIRNRRLTDKLMQANGFDEDALTANRMGELAPSQKKELVPNLVKAMLYSFVPLIVFAYLLLTQSLDAIIVVVLIVMAAISAIGFYVLYRVLVDLTGNRVLIVEGVGERKQQKITNSKGRRRTKFYYVIGEKSFEVKRKAYDAFVDGMMYRAYCTASSNKLVNIEVL